MKNNFKFFVGHFYEFEYNLCTPSMVLFLYSKGNSGYKFTSFVSGTMLPFNIIMPKHIAKMELVPLGCRSTNNGNKIDTFVRTK